MINCTKHFFKRWAERIVEVPLDDVSAYANTHREQIIEHANKLFDSSKFIYRGQIGDNITRNYYLKDNIVIVTNTTNDAMITIYKVDLGFPQHLNQTVIKGLLEEIEKLNEEKTVIEEEIEQDIEEKKEKIEELKIRRKAIEEHLKAIDNEINFLNDSIEQVKNKSQLVDASLKNYTLMLVNSKEYREDIKQQ